MSLAIVQLDNVSKQYKQLRALNQVNLTLKAGEALGLFGHNGAGKTTMMKVILGIIDVTSGTARVFDTDPCSKQAWHSRKSIGYLPENVSFYDQLTGLEVLTYFSRLKSVPKGQVKSLLQDVGLHDARNQKVKHYSKGMRQRLGLAQAFLGEPKLLLLDEPTVGLDPIATQDFYTSVDQLKDKGASVLLCSHVLPGVEKHIDRAMILSQGTCIATGTLESLRQQAQLPVTIKTQGLNGALAAHPRLTGFMTTPNCLHIPESETMTVVKELVNHESLQDIQVTPANLEQIYQYFLSHSDSLQKEVKL
ncbi:ABC transporter ATP-binding protein [Vibrio tubiashii]|uniref:ABC transporter for copper ATP-binding protein n=1 Tax=Vibrio tubiashii ATCC 19109 TaxID=1051646 RepID=F9TAD1_9VIBR|nr:ABC transporter ATP-binding protein [Vibrio tubiashii]AIW14738.1 copper ABC transporter ATP-binding protein [Vibrio tubiashii ATCC 19109]EGU50111.1 ABC transporter for copper ATP-binding protein [Vibrio tubiashii ATCC 19109]EIF03336.1 ABC transporter for copper ATP-binding protein [Vibrio tubiashii NCIMB 1337 = ATCC 19106]